VRFIEWELPKEVLEVRELMPSVGRSARVQLDLNRFDGLIPNSEPRRVLDRIRSRRSATACPTCRRASLRPGAVGAARL